MQFSIVTILTLAAVAIASPTGFAKRQDIGANIPPSTPSMADANGNVVAFSSKDVHLGTKRGVYIKRSF
ncbi:hypothetical protein HDV63DRAFT_404109 [Trichoderma sp. SZMC 28014]